MSILTDAYTGELTKAQVDALTKLKTNQFTATLTYGVVDKIGTDGTGEKFIIRQRTVNHINLLSEVQEFIHHVQGGRAIQMAGTTTTAPTTSTTTTAPTTSTTTVAA